MSVSGFQTAVYDFVKYNKLIFLRLKWERKFLFWLRWQDLLDTANMLGSVSSQCGTKPWILHDSTPLSWNPATCRLEWWRAHQVIKSCYISFCRGCPCLGLTPSLPQSVKFPGWKMHGCACKRIFSGPITHLLSVLWRFDENPFKCQCKKEEEKEQKKKLRGFQISHFYLSFSNDIAVKGLSTEITHETNH